MNPKYQFYLDGNISYPVWGDNLAKVIKRESGQMFFRESLSAPIVFNGSEYAYIVGKVFDWEFHLEIRYSTDGGSTYNTYWKGIFKKQDCRVDVDAQTVEVNPTVEDVYTTILNNWEKEIDLVRMDNPPAMQTIKAARRPALQLYIAGESTIFTYVSGMYWEAACQAETDDEKLTGDYNFARVTDKLIAITDQTGGMPESFEAAPPATPDTAYTLLAANGYKFVYSPQAGPSGTEEAFAITDANNTPLYLYRGENDYSGFPRELTLPQVGGGDSIKVSVRNLSVYSRLLLDTQGVTGAVKLPLEDIIENNRNYRYVAPYNFSDSFIGYTSQKSNIPTPYGLYQPGVYYAAPTFIGGGEAFPITPNAWGTMSVWVDATNLYDSRDEQGRRIFAIKNAYPLGSVIQALVGQINPMIYFPTTTTGSQFLYGTTPIEDNNGKGLFITPKSNITNANYDQPAQKGVITLRGILDMLRDTFRCYWFIENNVLRIEHIEFFRRGGSYTGAPTVEADLTTDEADRNFKKWAFAQNKYNYDKSQLIGRYSFRWMDDVTEPFRGYPIQMINGYNFQPRDGMEETIQIQQFSTDLDYIMLNPTMVSKDGFCMFKAALTQTVTPDNPIEIIVPDLSPVGAIVTVIDYAAEPGERIFLRLGYVPPSYTPDYTLELLAVDAADRVIESLSGPMPAGYWDTTIGHYYNLPRGTASIRARFLGGTITLTTFESDNYYTVGYYEYFPDGYNQVKRRLLQNGELSFAYLQRYYIYDLPVRNYEINGCGWMQIGGDWVLTMGNGYAVGIKRSKQQEVSFPAETDPDTKKLIKTDLGSGNIENITLNLSSRNAKATLGYEPT